MPLYRNALPQLDGSLFLTDAGLETDLIFNHGVEIREFAAHTLLPDSTGRAAVIGPRGDAYRPERRIEAADAEAYYAEQLGWLAPTETDMVTGLTFNQAGEAVGLVRAARTVGLPVAISFTVETDGRLPDGQPLSEAIEQVDAATGGETAYFMVNCAHPDHFADALAVAQRVRRLLRQRLAPRHLHRPRGRRAADARRRVTFADPDPA